MNIVQQIDNEILRCLKQIHSIRKRAWKEAPYTMEMFYAADKTDFRINELKNTIEKLRVDRENVLARYRATYNRK